MPPHDQVRRIRRGMESLIGVPATEGNAVKVLENGSDAFPRMIEAVRAAESTVDLLTFRISSGRVVEDLTDALVDRAGAGVRVRVLLDAIGSRSFGRADADRLRESGVELEWFRPPTTWKVWRHDHRTHRKVLVCDHRVGFVGGMNFGEQWEGDARGADEWRDTHLEIEGPAVDGLRAAFVSDWVEAGRPICDEDEHFPEMAQAGGSVVQVVRGGAETGWSDIASMFEALVKLARRRVRITTAYFAPDEAFTALLVDACRRGVELEVILPGPNAHSRVVQLAAEAQYDRLLGAGTRILSYQPTMIHAKVVTVDGAAACVGSANFDRRSMQLNHEVAAVVFDESVVDVLDRQFEADAARSVEIDAERWRGRPLRQRALELGVTAVRSRL